MPERIGDRYRVLGPLGQGGQGQVLAVEDERRPGLRLAAKTVAGELDPASVAVLATERASLQAVDHPGLVAFADWVEDAGRPWLLTRLIEGPDLLRAAEAAGEPGAPGRTRGVLELAAALLHALEHLHARELVHLDLKPAQVLVGSDGPVLLDLGLCARAGEVACRGTPGYAAPEVRLGHPVDRRADLWSLGATLHQALTGLAPDPRAAPDPDRAPEAARTLLRALLEPERTARPASAGEALALLGAALGREVAPAQEGPLPPIEGPLQGRAAELSRLLAPLDGAGSPALLIGGPRGAGRSRLLRAAGVRALAAGAEVHAVDTASGLGPFLGRLGLDLRADPGDPERARARLRVEAGRRARAAASGRPWVLVADDAERLPEDALELLEAVASALRGEPDPAARGAVWIACADGLGTGAALERLRRGLHDATLPLAPLALPPAPSGRAPRPAGSAARDLQDALALLDRPLAPTRLAPLLTPLAPDARAAAIAAAGLRPDAQGRLWLADPALRATLRAGLDPRRTARLAASLLAAPREGDDLDERAELHLLAGDPDATGGELVLDAAREAAARGALGRAAGLLERLLALGPGVELARAARTRLAEVELARGEGERAVAHWQALKDDVSAPAAERGAAAARAARQLLCLYRDEEALRAADQAEALLAPEPPAATLLARGHLAWVRELAAAYADPAGHQPDRARLDALRAEGASGAALAALGTTLGIVLYRADRLEDAARLLEVALADARGAQDARAEGFALLNLAICRQRQGQAEEAAQLTAAARAALERAGDVQGVATADLESGLRLLRASRYRPCVPLLGAALSTFALLGDRPRAAEARMNRGAALLRLGELARAADDLRAALPELAQPGLQLFARGDLAWLLAEQGQAAAAEAELTALEALLPAADPHFALQGRVQRATALLALGRADEARAEAAAARAAAGEAADLRGAATTVLAEAALGGDPARAEEAARAALADASEPADRVRPEAALAHALLARDDLPAARAAALRAMDGAAAGDDALDRLEARRALGGVHLAAGEPGEAARLLAPAWLAARAAGLVRRAARLEAALAATLPGGALAALEQLEESAPRVEAGGGLLAKVVSGGPDAGHMLDLALGLLVEAIGAERGLLVLLDEAGHPAGTAARNLRDEERAGPQFAFSRRLVAEAAQRREPLLVPDALADPRFSEADSVASLAIRSVLTIPVLGQARDGGPAPVLAVLYLDDRSLPGRFDEGARDLAGRITAELAPAFRLARERAALLREQAGLRSRMEEAALAGATAEIVGQSEPVRALRRAITRAARTDFPVLIEGESGSGKELIARAIHAASRRAAGAFVAESCAAVADQLLESELFGHVKGAFTGADRDRQGIFAAASGGTLFLDEVSSMSEGMQAKLLRVLQEGQVRPVGAERTERVDVRVIAASNERLLECVAAGRFRQDLYYRLAVIGVPAPPLRERREDLPLLVDHFARKHGGAAAPLVSEPALRALSAWSWPGNVRELENLVRRLVAFRVGRVLVRHLPPEVQACVKDARPGQAPAAPVGDGLPLTDALEKIERQLIERALRQARGNVSQAARALGLERTKLIRRLKHFGIDAARPREETP